MAANAANATNAAPPRANTALPSATAAPSSATAAPPSGRFSDLFTMSSKLASNPLASHLTSENARALGAMGPFNSQLSENIRAAHYGSMPKFLVGGYGTKHDDYHPMTEQEFINNLNSLIDDYFNNDSKFDVFEDNEEIFKNASLHIEKKKLRFRKYEIKNSSYRLTPPFLLKMNKWIATLPIGGNWNRKHEEMLKDIESWDFEDFSTFSNGQEQTPPKTYPCLFMLGNKNPGGIMLGNKNPGGIMLGNENAGGKRKSRRHRQLKHRKNRNRKQRKTKKN